MNNLNNLFWLYLSLSISGSLVVLAFVLLKPLLRRFSKTWQYYLWLLVLLRWLVPFSPDSSLVGNLFERTEIYFTQQNAPPSNADQNISGRKEETSGGLSGVLPIENAPSQNLSASPVGRTVPFSFIPDIFPGALWLTAAVLLFARKVYGYRQFLQTVNMESQLLTDGRLCRLLQEVSDEVGLSNKFSVRIHPLVKAPMLIGVLKPAVLLPTEDIEDSECKNIFRHELTHVRRLDFLYKWLTEITVCLHWFNPLAYWVRRQINRDCEFSCDENVVSRLNDEGRQSYGETLIDSVRLERPAQTNPVFLSLSQDGRLLGERLLAIAQYRPKSKRMLASALLLTIFLSCGAVYAGAYSVNAAENAADGAVHSKPVSETGPQAVAAALPQDTQAGEAVVYQSVEMRRYEGEGGHPYIHDIVTNSTAKEIAGFSRGMLAFDKDGAPLKIDWFNLDTEFDSSYFYLYEKETAALSPGATEDVQGGWSLNFWGEAPSVEDIAYVLYCIKEITFADGTQWNNPDFDAWRDTFEGKEADVDILKHYYPYVQKITD